MLRRLLKGLAQTERLPEIAKARKLTPDWLRLLIAYLGYPVSLPFRIELPSGGFEFCERFDASTFWQVFIREVYPVRPDDQVILDAGANIGCFTLYALLRAPQAHVIAIEPAPDSCGRVRSMLREHGLSQRCTLHEAALGECRGQTRMSLRAPSHVRVTGEGEIVVPTLSLDELLAPCRRVDMLKIDTEGAEYLALTTASPATLRKINRIEMEYHPQGNPQLLLSHLRECGFQLLANSDSGGGYGMARLWRDSANSASA